MVGEDRYYRFVGAARRLLKKKSDLVCTTVPCATSGHPCDARPDIYVYIYIHVLSTYAYVFWILYTAGISPFPYIYLMRVRARLLGPYYCYYCRYTLLWDLAIIIWLLVAVARGCVVLIAMNVSTLYYDTAAVPYVIPLSKRARPSCDNVDIVKRVASYRATNRLHVFLSPFLFYSPLFI